MIAVVDELPAERVLRGETVIRSAEHADVRRVVRASLRSRMAMIELEEVARSAALSDVAHEGALAAVSGGDLPAHGAGDT